MDPARNKPVSLAMLAEGAAGERFDVTLQRAIDNIRDVNTDATAVRKVTLTLELRPSEDRETITSTINVTLTAPNLKKHSTPMWLDQDEKGQYVIVGLGPQGKLALPETRQSDIEDGVVPINQQKAAP